MEKRTNELGSEPRRWVSEILVRAHVSRRHFARLFLAGAAASSVESLHTLGEAKVVQLERAVVRFVAPEIGGVATPEFIFERELSFEARLEALADVGYEARAAEAYRERHVVVALERHIAETLLARLPIDPEPPGAALERQTRAARVQLIQAVGGPTALANAERLEGISVSELARILRRRARASLYLDQMVAPMLEPTNSELRAAHRAAPESLRSQPFASVVESVRRWYVGRRLAASASAFYQNARSRLQVTFL